MAAKKKPIPKAAAKGEPRMADGDTIERTIDMGETEVDGGMSRKEVLKGFGDSNEWADICSSYGILK